MHRYEVEEFETGQVTNLIGYTSTSEKLSVAIQFLDISDGDSNDKIPVIFKITFKGDKGLLKLTEDCTAFS